MSETSDRALWSPWYAWRPVRIGYTRHRWVWLGWLERRLITDFGTHTGPEWFYREPQP